MSKTVLLYDGDFLRYAIGYAHEKFVVKYGSDELYRDSSMLKCKEFIAGSGLTVDQVDISKVAGEVSHCLSSAKRAIQGAIKNTKADSVVIYLTGSTNFRNKVAKQKEYKGNRKASVKPLHYDALTNYLIEHCGAIVTSGIEADDALAIRALELLEKGDTPIIATADKDLSQLPVQVYNVQTFVLQDIPANPFGELVLKPQGTGATLKGYGVIFFYAQMLTGDVVDNIGGCSRIGAKKAFDLLSQCETEEECQKVVEAEYLRVYGDEMVKRTAWDGSEYVGNYKTLMLETGKLLWMLRERPNKSGSHIWKPWW